MISPIGPNLVSSNNTDITNKNEMSSIYERIAILRNNLNNNFLTPIGLQNSGPSGLANNSLGLSSSGATGGLNYSLTN